MSGPWENDPVVTAPPPAAAAPTPWDSDPVVAPAPPAKPTDPMSDDDPFGGLGEMADAVKQAGAKSFEALGQGEVRALQEGAQTAEMARQGKAPFVQGQSFLPDTPIQPRGPKPLPENTADYAQNLAWSDITTPSLAIAKLSYGLGHSAPSLAAGVAGGAVASAPFGGPEEPAGALAAIIGGGTSAGVASAAQALGPFYAAELAKTPQDPDGAFDRAGRAATDEGAISAAAWSAFGIPVFKGPLKQLLFQAFVGQPAVSVAGREVANVREGKPLTEGVAEEIPGTIAGTIVPALGHAALTGGLHGEAPKTEGAGATTEPAAKPAPTSSVDDAARALGMRPEDLGAQPWANDPVVADASPSKPIKVNTAADLDAAAQRIHPAPTDAQKDAGNYTKAHIDYQGFPVTLESAEGSTRSGVGPDGERWSVQMPAAYGYLRGSLGADGDHLDVYLGRDPQAKTVYAVDQNDAETGQFDEHKFFLGFPDQQTVLDTYERAFSDGRANERLGAITPMSVDQFRDFVDTAGAKAQRIPFAEIAPDVISRAPDIRPWERDDLVGEDPDSPEAITRRAHQDLADTYDKQAQDVRHSQTTRDRFAAKADALRQVLAQPTETELTPRAEPDATPTAQRLEAPPNRAALPAPEPLKPGGVTLGDEGSAATDHDQQLSKLYPNRRIFPIMRDGQRVGTLLGQIDGKNFNVDHVFADGGPRSLGVATTRALFRQLRDRLPGVETIGGRRVTGARNGPAAVVPERTLNAFGRAKPIKRGKETSIDAAQLQLPRSLVGVGGPFYSELSRAIDTAKQERAPGAQWLAMLKNRPGIKPDEIADTGVGEFLTENASKPVTRAQLQGKMAEGGVQLEEHVAGSTADPSGIEAARGRMAQAKADFEAALRRRGVSDDISAHAGTDFDRLVEADPELSALFSKWNEAASDVDFIEEAQGQREIYDPTATRFEQYTLPGGTNYREMKLTLPEKPATGKEGPAGWAEAGNSRSREGDQNFRSSHFEEPNILAHARLKDRVGPNGEKILHVEEIQSDWHQKGRREGYKSPEDEEAARVARAKLDELQPFVNAVLKSNDNLGFDNTAHARNAIARESPAQWEFNSPEELAAAQRWHDAHRDFGEALKKTQGVPDAPFKKTWHELMLKRLLAYASEHGYDKLAWTPGEAQAERYDLSKYIDNLKVVEGRYEEVPGKDGYQVTAGRNGREVFSKRVAAKELPDVIGKDMAEKVLRQIQENKQRPVPRYFAEFSGLDLKVGGEGMKGFYDKIVPDFLNRYGKKFGAKVGETSVDVGEFKVNKDSHETLPYRLEKKDSPDILARFKTGDEAWAEAERRGATKLPSIDITDQMREEVARGQPLYQRPQRAISNAELDNMARDYQREKARDPLEDIHPTMLKPHEEAHYAAAINAAEQVFAKMMPRLKDRLALKSMKVRGEETLGAHMIRPGVGPLILYAMEFEHGGHRYLNPDVVGTIRHEGIHYLLRNGFIRSEEWRSLEDEARAKGWIQKHNIDINYAKLPEHAQLEEAIAEEYGVGRPKMFAGYPAPVRAVFLKMYRMFRRVYAAVKGALGDKMNASDIFDLIERGTVGQREPETNGMFRGEAQRQAARPEDALKPEDDDLMRRMEATDLEDKPSFDKLLDEVRALPSDRAIAVAKKYAIVSSKTKKAAIASIENDRYTRLRHRNENEGVARAAQNINDFIGGSSGSSGLRPKDFDVKRQAAREPTLGDKPIEDRVPVDPEKAPRDLIERLSSIIPQKAKDVLNGVWGDLQMITSPMAAGERTKLASKATTEARATAKDFANADRLARWHAADTVDKLTKQFGKDPDALRRMWIEADRESVARQRGEKLAPGEGLAGLSDTERKTVQGLQREAQQTWNAAVSLGMVEGEGLPSYVPRIVAEMADTGARTLKGGEVPGNKGNLDQLGRNLKTSSRHMLKRKYETTEQTEAAARNKFGEQAGVIRDIRTLPLATMSMREALAGRAVINKIKEIGERTGDLLVHEGSEPQDGNKWFTLDHPAFKKWQVRLKKDETSGKYEAVKDQDGNPVFDKVPIYVRSEFEGPLRAILSQKSGLVYRALMDMKGRAMTAIMYSPLIHNAVEWGRALPAMFGKVVTFRIYFEGNAAKRDPVQMAQAIRDGMAPIGHGGGAQDITSQITMPNVEPGRSVTSHILAALPGLFDRATGTKSAPWVKRTADKFGNFWHNTLLWDRVADLQMGLYTNFKKQMLAKGIDEQSAGRMAAHFANRYAGALPQESMSHMSRKIANLTLFSRTFTLGNLGAMKDMVTGLPRDVQAQILRDAGQAKLDKVNSYARRKAIGIVAMDIALLYGMNSVLQSAVNVISGRKDLAEEEKGYIDRLKGEMKRINDQPTDLLNTNPFDWLRDLTPMSENEPRDRDRVFVGNDTDGTAIYARNPAGKIGEEFKGWITNPLDMISRKESTFIRPTMQLLAQPGGDAGFGRTIYDPYAKTTGEWVQNIGRIVGHYMEAQVPLQSLQAGWDLMTNPKAKASEGFKVLGPLAGVTFSSGAPGGPAVGAMYDERQRFQQTLARTLPDARKLIQAGNTDGAAKMLADIGTPAGLIKYYIRTTINPSSRMSKRAMQDFMRRATPEEKESMNRMVQEQH